MVLSFCVLLDAAFHHSCAAVIKLSLVFAFECEEPDPGSKKCWHFFSCSKRGKHLHVRHNQSKKWAHVTVNVLLFVVSAASRCYDHQEGHHERGGDYVIDRCGGKPCRKTAAAGRPVAWRRKDPTFTGDQRDFTQSTHPASTPSMHFVFSRT